MGSEMCIRDRSKDNGHDDDGNPPDDGGNDDPLNMGGNNKKNKPPGGPPDGGGDGSGSSSSTSDSDSGSSSGSIDNWILRNKKYKVSDEVKIGHLPTPAQFRAWKNTLYQNVNSASGRYDDQAIKWVMEVENRDISIDQLRHVQTKWRLLDRRLSAALQRAACLLYTSPSPRDATLSRMPSSA